MLGQRHAEEARFAHAAENGRIGLLSQIGLLDAGGAFQRRELAGALADGAFVFVKLIVQQQRGVPGEPSKTCSMRRRHRVLTTRLRQVVLS
jgi:hypothetical protein